jgi:hypothetical protein
MAHLDSISKDLLARVAAEIGDLLNTRFRSAAAYKSEAKPIAVPKASALRLGETLTVWKLKARAFEALKKTSLSGDLSDWVEQSGFLHHQIKFNGETAGFVRSYLECEIESKSIFQVSTSPFAAAMNQRFEIIEANETKDPIVADDPVVRLVEVPPCHVFALWVFSESRKESRVLLIEAPKSCDELSRYILSSDQFFDALKKSGPLMGIA